MKVESEKFFILKKRKQEFLLFHILLLFIESYEECIWRWWWWRTAGGGEGMSCIIFLVFCMLLLRYMEKVWMVIDKYSRWRMKKINSKQKLLLHFNPPRPSLELKSLINHAIIFHDDFLEYTLQKSIASSLKYEHLDCCTIDIVVHSRREFRQDYERRKSFSDVNEPQNKTTMLCEL